MRRPSVPGSRDGGKSSFVPLSRDRIVRSREEPRLSSPFQNRKKMTNFVQDNMPKITCSCIIPAKELSFQNTPSRPVPTFEQSRLNLLKLYCSAPIL